MTDEQRLAQLRNHFDIFDWYIGDDGAIYGDQSVHGIHVVIQGGVAELFLEVSDVGPSHCCEFRVSSEAPIEDDRETAVLEALCRATDSIEEVWNDVEVACMSIDRVSQIYAMRRRAERTLQAMQSGEYDENIQYQAEIGDAEALGLDATAEELQELVGPLEDALSSLETFVPELRWRRTGIVLKGSDGGGTFLSIQPAPGWTPGEDPEWIAVLVSTLETNHAAIQLQSQPVESFESPRDAVKQAFLQVEEQARALSETADTFIVDNSTLMRMHSGLQLVN